MIKRTFKAIAFLMTAVILAAGFVSCTGGAEEITGSYSSENTSGGRTLNTSFPNFPKDYAGLPNDTTLPDDNPSDYYKIRVPFGVGGDGYTNVSYKDTNTLKQLWFEQIGRKAVNDGRVFAIRNRANDRDANNFQKRHTDGEYSAQDYYYFNWKGDIVYKEDNTVIKEFMGAVITKYRNISIERGQKTRFGINDNRQAIINISWTPKEDYTVGAIYANALTTEQAREKYMGDNPFKDGVFDFITYWHHVQTFHNGPVFANNIFERQYINPGFLEVFVICDYYYSLESGEAAVHSYYPYYGIYNYHERYENDTRRYFTPENMPYMTNHNIYLGQKPNFIDEQLNHSAEFTDKHRNWQFMFVPGHRN